jgi:hypothetical protein
MVAPGGRPEHRVHGGQHRHRTSDRASPETHMPAAFTLLGVLLIIIAIPFGLMFAPLVLGILFVSLAWRHVAASYEHDGLGVA